MRIIMLCICLLGSLFSVHAQNKKLLVFENKKIDASIPFYTVSRMSCRLGGTQIVLPEREKYERYENKEGIFFTLRTRDKFSIFDAKISSEAKNSTALTEQFHVYVYQEDLPRHWNAVNFQVYLQEKDWEEQKATMVKKIETELQSKFPNYQLKVELSSSTKFAKTTMQLRVCSYTGGDEFETTAAQRERSKKMQTEITPTVNQLLYKYHTQRLRKLQREIIKPYKQTIISQLHPQEVHTMKFDIQSLGEYNPDKKQFKNIRCNNNWSLEYLGVPIEEAKLLRAKPTEYQLRSYVFEGEMSSPWSPNKDPAAFGFHEIIHTPTNTILTRTYAKFRVSSTQYFYKYTITFPRY